MRMRQASYWIATAAAGLLTLTACGQSVSPVASDEEAHERRTAESCGQPVTLDGDPQRIVSMMPGTTDLLVRLGVADRIVGEAQGKGAALNSQLDGEAVVILSEDSPPSREVLLNVEPDLVVSPTSYEFTAEQGFASIDQLGDAGAGVYIAAAGCFDRRKTAEVSDLVVDIENLPALLGVKAQGSELASSVEAEISAIESAVAERENPSVAQLYIEGTTISAIGAGLEYDTIRTAGGDNVFDPADPEFSDFIAAVISPETLIARDPQVIVISVENDAHERAVRDFLTSRFGDVSAVREDRIVAVSSDAVMPGTWGNIEVLRQLAHAFHTGVF
ncbi:ABC transporter substrate-binding protein [Hoyosella subflava]|nr:ABC transporter substrate-binding protein [Hoyosella subflava]